MTNLEDRYTQGRKIALRGAALALKEFRDGASGASDSKLAPLDLVTRADKAVEIQLREELAQAFPEDGFWGEETGGDAGDAMWVADPIDGTSNFVAGLPLWGTSLAYVENGRSQIGFVIFPVLDLVYEARAGLGATCNGRALNVATTGKMNEARVIFGRSPAMHPANPLAFATGVLDQGAVIYAFNCCIYNLTRIAEGACHAYYEEMVHPWDYAAAGLIASEAGAKVSMNMTPEAYRDGCSLFAATPQLWDATYPHARMRVPGAAE